MIANRRGKVLLVDNDQGVVELLKKTAEKSGYDVSTLSGLKRVEETKPLLQCIQFDLVAISSRLTAEAPHAVSSLRRALDCPVVVYERDAGMELNDARAGSKWNTWLEYKNFYEKMHSN